MPLIDQITWGQTLHKVLKVHDLDPFISRNIGHSDLHFGIEIKAFHTINNHHASIKSAFNGQNMRPNASKKCQDHYFDPHISPEI